MAWRCRGDAEPGARAWPRCALRPDGVVREVVFPVASEQTLRDLVKEWKATGPAYRTTLRTVIRNSYGGHYRRMTPKVIQALEFRSNNEAHRPVIRAIELLRRHADSKERVFPADEDVPLDGIVNGLWRDAVMENDAKDRKRVKAQQDRQGEHQRGRQSREQKRPRRQR